MEAKLRQIEGDKARALNPAPQSTLPFNPTLPLKPPAPSAAPVPANGPQHRKTEKPPNLPAFPIAPPSLTSSKAGSSTESKPKVVRETRSKLTGVIIKKAKAKKAVETTESKEPTPSMNTTS
ncbi:hypothetical protein FA13DRAFT_1750437 [Coprinellus micaceus]|uniref:Uncharacterized protein n=1 Tax=Coprinellus micaceus TaxID=71717 RepID=A0A4Y7R7Z4_COPMI|nr:hypothetical protein FA13DRAFT_1750437 [Coprinellus micaceus]